MSVTEFQASLPTVTRTIVISDRLCSMEGSVQQGEFLQDLAQLNELHLTTVSLVVLTKTVLTDQEALWTAFNKLQKHLDVVEG